MKKIIFPILTLIVFGCQNSTSTKASDTTHADSVKTNADAKDNIAILKSFYEKTAEKMDTVAYAGFFANNFTEYGDGTKPPYVFSNPDSLTYYYKRSYELIPDLKVTDVEYFIGDSGKVVVVSTGSGIWTGIDLSGQKATGKSFKYTDAEIYTLDANGKITSHRNIYPSASVAEQVGFKMPKK